MQSHPPLLGFWTMFRRLCSFLISATIALCPSLSLYLSLFGSWDAATGPTKVARQSLAILWGIAQRHSQQSWCLMHCPSEGWQDLQGTTLQRGPRDKDSDPTPVYCRDTINKESRGRDLDENNPGRRPSPCPERVYYW